MNPEPQRSSPSAAASGDDLQPGDARAWLSALADGDAAAAANACAAWRDDAEARRTWHAYHLIGDVMRSEDLATRPRRDADFLAGVRARLAAEPVVLAPQPAAVTATRRRQPWMVPVAAAAGFAAVAGVLVVTRMGAPGAGWADPGTTVATSAASASTQGVPLRAVSTTLGQSLRDPRLDEMLRAHAQARGAFAAPGSELRRAEITITQPER